MTQVCWALFQWRQINHQTVIMTDTPEHFAESLSPKAIMRRTDLPNACIVVFAIDAFHWRLLSIIWTNFSAVDMKGRRRLATSIENLTCLICNLSIHQVRLILLYISHQCKGSPELVMLLFCSSASACCAYWIWNTAEVYKKETKTSVIFYCTRLSLLENFAYVFLVKLKCKVIKVSFRAYWIHHASSSIQLDYHLTLEYRCICIFA